jgi:hypothetical protein
MCSNLEKFTIKFCVLTKLHAILLCVLSIRFCILYVNLRGLAPKAKSIRAVTLAAAEITWLVWPASIQWLACSIDLSAIIFYLAELLDALSSNYILDKGLYNG